MKVRNDVRPVTVGIESVAAVVGPDVVELHFDLSGKAIALRFDGPQWAGLVQMVARLQRRGPLDS